MRTETMTLPDLGEGLTEAELVRWLVAVGDVVAIDSAIAEVETAKATVEVPMSVAGTVIELHWLEGQTISVGSPLLSVSPNDPPEGHGHGRAESYQNLVGYGASHPIAGRRRKKTRTTGSLSRVPTAAGASSGERRGNPPAVLSPRVRTLARHLGVDLGLIAGTGPEGLITRDDVETAIAARARGSDTARAPAPTTPPDYTLASPSVEPTHVVEAATGTDTRTGLPISVRVPLKGLRRTVAENLGRSRQEIPDATTWVDVDATPLTDLLTRLRESGSSSRLMGFLARFVVEGLSRFPELNTRVDVERGEIVHFEGVNLGIATQTVNGLVVPVIRHADRLGVGGLQDEIDRVVDSARKAKLDPRELIASSFTLNNYGRLGVDGSSAIINHPEVAILGIGRIYSRPWIMNRSIVARDIVQISLSFDHRVCDGGTAGGFLRYLADAIEDPGIAMIDV